MRLINRILAAALLLSWGCSTDSASEHVDLVAHAVLTAKHGRGAALRVAFLPTPESCSPQDLIATRALTRLAEERPDVAVLTLVPRGLPLEPGMAGLPFPGAVVDLPLNVLQSRRKVPRPRFEVYAEDGRLLLLRPVHPYEEERRLVEEVLSLLRYSAAPVRGTGA